MEPTPLELRIRMSDYVEQTCEFVVNRISSLESNYKVEVYLLGTHQCTLLLCSHPDSAVDVPASSNEPYEPTEISEAVYV